MELYEHDGMELYVYDENVELIGIIDTYISLIWTDRYSRAGYFELYVTASKRNVQLLKRFRYVCRPEITEKNIMYINGIQTKWSQDNGRCLIVTGYTADGLLRKRIMTTVASGSMLSILRRTLEQSPISGVEIETDEALAVPADVYYEDRSLNAEEWAFKSIKRVQKNVSLNSKFSMEKGKIIIGLREGRDRSLELSFSDESDNIISSEYAFSEEGCGNAIIAITKRPTDGEFPNGLPIYVYDNGETGVERTEISIEVEPIMKEVVTETGSYMELDYSATLSALKRQATGMTKPYTESFFMEIGNIKDYRVKWKVGDLVAVKNSERKTTYIKRIEEVKEVYDRNGFRIFPTLGESIKNIFDIVKGR